MSTHVDVDGDCPLAIVPCQYTDIGCKFKVRATCYRMLHMVITAVILTTIVYSSINCLKLYHSLNERRLIKALHDWQRKTVSFVSPLETLSARGNKTHCFLSAGPVIKCFVILLNSKLEKTAKKLFALC